MHGVADLGETAWLHELERMFGTGVSFEKCVQRYLEKWNDLYETFMDLEKGYFEVDRDALCSCEYMV